MSDKLEWLNKHILFFEHRNLSEVVSVEHYPVTTELLQLAGGSDDCNDYFAKLLAQKRYKDLNTFFAYNLHRRVAIWWAYLCVLDLRLEQQANPEKPRDIADIGKPRELKAPSWASADAEEPEDDIDYKALADDIQKKSDEARKFYESVVPKEWRDTFQEAIDLANAEFKKENGMDPMEMLDAVVKMEIDDDPIDYNSPLFKAEGELKEAIEKTRKETVDLIKKALPPEDKPAKNQFMYQSLDGVWKYIVRPDATNAAPLLELGNQCPDEPEGLLALSAFWSYGNMTPLAEEQLIKTPDGLMSNGINSLLLMLALKQGGTRKFDERMERYFKFAYKAAIGLSSWVKYSAEEGASPIVPHQHLKMVIEQEEQEGESETQSVAQQSANNSKEHPAMHRKPEVERFRG
ncbi:MAG: hypothetical protein J6M93_06555 [Succinivibrio sp.]|nr:hypothetical protein [Succinivibrio sp.]